MLGIIAWLGLFVLDVSVSWLRMLVALFASILIGLGLGILANRSAFAEQLIIPIVDILQTIPILAFFPFVVYIVVAALPGVIGINLAVIFLIITSMVWNIGFGAYEAIKAIPAEFNEVAGVFQLGSLERLRKITIPAAMPKVIEQSVLSWSIGLFYLVTSEIFSVGLQIDSVRYGIGAELAKLAFQTPFNLGVYVLGIIVFIGFVIATRFLLFGYLERRFIKRSYVRRKGGSLARMFGGFASRLGAFSGLEKEIKREFRGEVRVLEREEAREVARLKRTIRRVSLVVIVALAAIALVALAVNGPLRAEEATVLYSLAFSITRVWVAFALMLAITVPLGIYIIFMARRGSTYMLLFQVLASIPATIILPALAVGLKSVPNGSEVVAFSIFFLSGFWYMLFSIVSTRAVLQPSVGEVRKVFEVRGWKAWKSIYLKAIIPGLITGGITAIAAEWNAAIVAERFTTSIVGSGAVIVSVGTGLGRLLDVALASGNLGLMALGLINLTIMIIIINRLLWKRLYGKAMAVYK
jgi:NitT/TauT family transport system permease protein